MIDLDNPEYALPWQLAQRLFMALDHVEHWETFLRSHESLSERWKHMQQLMRKGQIRPLQQAWEQFEQLLQEYVRQKIRGHPGTVLIMRLDTAEWLRNALEKEEPPMGRLSPGNKTPRAG